MNYDENSFLQGIAVGRAMKGIAVARKTDEARISASAALLLCPIIAPDTAILQPGPITDAPAVISAILLPLGEIIDAGVKTVPLEQPYSALSAAGTADALQEVPFSADSTPSAIGGTISASGTIEALDA